MAPTGSPRDHDADANPDVSRKRARLSEEGDSPVSNDEVEIEALAPELMGGDPINAIEIDDDENMAPYSESFQVFPNKDPIVQVKHLHRRILAEPYLQISWFIDASSWLADHIETTKDQPNSALLPAYAEEELFFGEFAAMAHSLLERNEMFDEDEVVRHPEVNYYLSVLVVNLMKLSVRFILLLPDITKELLARRDSAQLVTKPGEQYISLLHYIRTASLLLSLNAKSHPYLRHPLGLDLKQTRDACRAMMQEEKTIPRSLVAVLRDLTQHVREVKDAWLFIGAILAVGRSSLYTGENAESVLEITNQAILPAIREKHPRALPEGFHEQVVRCCGHILKHQQWQSDFSQPWQLYERVVKGNEDALLPEGEPNAEKLRRVCDDDMSTISPMLNAAWVLQAYKSFIFSSIMDVRSCGITLLSLELGDWYRKHCEQTDGGVDHPVIQYAARFLRRNELTTYIFSANSHASIISHSENIISFLAYTLTYTDQETDTIWQACTTSVEADFVKASFAVLQHVSRKLGFDHLRYVVQKYTTTRVARISSQSAVETLSSLFTHLHEAVPPADSRKGSLSAVMLGVDLLDHLHTEERTPATESLVNMAMAQISYAHKLGIEDKLQVYQRCVPSIVSQSDSATSATKVLAMFLRASTHAEEAEQLLAMLPAKVAVDELCHYVTQTAKTGAVDKESLFASLVCRVVLVVHLLSLRPVQRDPVTEDLLFQFLMGELAIDNDARNIAWAELGFLSKGASPPDAATFLLDHYLVQLVPSTPAKHATPALIGLLIEPLRNRVYADSLQAEYPHILGWPLWKTLVRIAAESPDPATANTALTGMCDVLFAWPQRFTSKSAIVQCHAQFVREFVDRLCNEYADLSRFVNESEVRVFCQGLGVLSVVFQKSKQMESSFQLPKPPDKIIIATKDAEPFCFSIQINSPQRQQGVISVQASKSTTIAELAAALPARTGASDHRVIVGGRSLDLDAVASKTLSEAGVQASGVINISPRYTSDCDLDKVLTDPGPVEQELLAQYGRLETFLDGPNPVAQSAYHLLATMTPSALAVSRIAKPGSTVNELFPPERPWKTVHSLYLLGSILDAYAKVGVADERFIVRGAHFLTDFIMDDARTLDPGLLLSVATRLHQFLLGTPSFCRERSSRALSADSMPERPKGDTSAQYFDNPSAFAARVIDIILQAMLLPIQATPSPATLPVRTDLVLAVYRTTLQACRIDARVWNSFTENARSASLHAQMLLDDEDSSLSPFLAECMKNFCIDQSTPVDSVERYWCMTMMALEQALERPFASTAFFQLATELLNRNAALQADETKVRSLVEELLRKLREYTHLESPDFPIADNAMVGLLQLLSAAISVLKSFKKPLEIGGLSVELFERLLFVPAEATYRPLLHDASRGVVFDIIKATCESLEDYRGLANAACLAMHFLPPDPNQKFPGLEGWIRPSARCAGLTNLGMTCYMNSLLQQLFANLAFRKFIFDTPIVDSERQVFLAYVQELFARMQDGALCAAETSNLAKVLAIQTQNQEDVHGFYATFLSRLEEGMPDDDRRKALSTFYTGKFISQIKGSCGHVSTQTEPFIDMAITVKNKSSLSDSLNEFVQGEPMQGANMYRCLTCDPESGRLVDAMKRTCLDEVPHNLTFCLKRFTFEAMMGLEGKVNDRFEFPQQIDMAVYERQHLEQPDKAVEPDIFELIGVIVHQGTLEFGHYWSYVRLAGSSDWVRLEDQNVQACGSVQEVQQQCFGGHTYANGQEKADSGYVLLYQRQSHLHEQAQLIKPCCGPVGLSRLLPPKVQVPAEQAQFILNDSLWRHKVANLFAMQFSGFMDWLVGTWPGVESNESDEDNMSETTITRDDEGLAAAAVKYMFRVILTDHPNQKKLQSCTQSITSALSNHGTPFAKQVLQGMVDDPAFCAAIWRHSHAEYRAAASTLIECLLVRLKESGEECYTELFRQVISIHSSLLPDISLIYSQWPEYFRFAATLARLGPTETALVLDGQYLDSIWEVLYYKWQPDYVKRRHQPLVTIINTDRINMTALFSFLHSVLSEHVDLSPMENDSPQTKTHQVVDGLVCLHQHEWGMLAVEAEENRTRHWVLASIGCRTCPATVSFEDYAPGKLVALLVGRKTNGGMIRLVERGLFIRFDDEQSALQQMLDITLHFCLARGDRECKEILKRLGRNLPPWRGCETEVLRFFDVAIKIARGSVIESAPEWAYEFLKIHRLKVRQGTRLWLAENVFVDPQPNAPLTASRLRASRALAGQCLPYLRKAYDQEMSKSHFEEMFDTMAIEMSWLSALHDELYRILNNNEAKQGGRISQELLIEFDEAKVTLKMLKEVLGDLQDWESDSVAFSTAVLTDARKSVEVGDSDLEAADEEDDLSEIDDDVGSEQ